jgi:hypothetical protein
MSSIGIFKRIVPFVVALVIGLFIASFFVDLTPRPFTFRSTRQHRCRDFERLYIEQRERNARLQQENDMLRQNPITLKHTEPWDAPDLYVPPPPKAPRAR